MGCGVSGTLWSVLCGGSGMGYLRSVVYFGSVVYLRSVVKDVSEWCMRSLVCKVKEVSSILKFKEKHMIQT